MELMHSPIFTGKTPHAQINAANKSGFTMPLSVIKPGLYVFKKNQNNILVVWFSIKKNSILARLYAGWILKFRQGTDQNFSQLNKHWGVLPVHVIIFDATNLN